MDIITNQIRTDGFGAQFQTIIATILYAEMNGKKYYYTKPDFTKVYSEEEIKEIENIMNILNNYPHFKDDGTVFECSSAIRFLDINLDECLKSKSMKKLKNIFLKNKKNPFEYDKHINVVVHIRRPSNKSTIDIPEHLNGEHVKNVVDFSHFDYGGGRFTNDFHFIETIKKIKEKYKNSNLKIHICSEGDVSLFKNFSSENVTLHLNESLTDTFCKMVFANVLVISKSSFSYSAALMSEGEIWYTNFWCSSASHWIKN